MAVNRRLDVCSARLLAKRFLEVLVVPDWTAAARRTLARRKKLRVLTGPLADATTWDLRILGGLALYQERDRSKEPVAALPCPTRRKPDPDKLADLEFAWRTVKHAFSNAVLIARGGMTIGIGSGQTSRLQAAEQALAQARRHGHDPAGAVAASDGFFPFADGLAVLAEAGVVATIQPSGSKRDLEVVAAADEHGMAMLMATTRHFRH